MMDLDAVLPILQPFIDREHDAGRKAYLAPLGASLLQGSMTKPLGAISYVRAFLELLDQCEQQHIPLGTVVLATGSGSMQAGLVAGARLLCPNLKVVGISVSDDRLTMFNRVSLIVEQTLREFESTVPVSKDDIVVFDNYIGGGYGEMDRATAEAVRLVAKTEGVLLDPVYTGKAMVGLIELAHQGYLRTQENVVFLHSGGTPALFPYSDSFCKYLSPNPISTEL
jgi:D-cysteine desulfhydrase